MPTFKRPTQSGDERGWIKAAGLTLHTRRAGGFTYCSHQNDSARAALERRGWVVADEGELQAHNANPSGIVVDDQAAHEAKPEPTQDDDHETRARNAAEESETEQAAAIANGEHDDFLDRLLTAEESREGGPRAALKAALESRDEVVATSRVNRMRSAASLAAAEAKENERTNPRQGVLDAIAARRTAMSE